MWFDDKPREVYATNVQPLSEGDSSVCNEHLLQSIYLINCQQVMKTSISDTNTSLQTFMPLIGESFLSEWLLQPMFHVNHLLLQFTESRILFWAVLHCFPNYIVTGFRPELLRWPHISQDELWGLILNMPLKSAAIPIIKFHKVGVGTYLRWGGGSLWCVCTQFPLESDSERIL